MTDEIEWEGLGGGVSRKFLGYDNQIMMVQVKFDEGALGSSHQHFHTQATYVVSGKFEFEIDGETYTLEAYASGEQLFYVFGDQTNRDATYGAGRFLYSAMPGDDGITVLDFNKSYSPPCAFNDFSTCPVASPRNRLPIRIEAGEKFEPSLHFSAEH